VSSPDLTSLSLQYTNHRVAVDPSTRSLYANVWNQEDGIQVYDMDTFALKDTLVPAPGQSFPREIQGQQNVFCLCVQFGL